MVVVAPTREAVGIPTSCFARTSGLSKNMAFVYFLKNNKEQYYIGSTENIDERMKHHLGGYTPSTSKMGKLRLVFKQEFSSLSKARKIEQRLKKLKRKDYIEKILKDGYIKMEI